MERVARLFEKVLLNETAEKLRFSAVVKARGGGGVALLENVRRTFFSNLLNKAGFEFFDGYFDAWTNGKED